MKSRLETVGTTPYFNGLDTRSTLIMCMSSAIIIYLLGHTIYPLMVRIICVYTVVLKL